MLESMRLAHELRGALGDGDPLPPEDRVVEGPMDISSLA